MAKALMVCVRRHGNSELTQFLVSSVNQILGSLSLEAVGRDTVRVADDGSGLVFGALNPLAPDDLSTRGVMVGWIPDEGPRHSRWDIGCSVPEGTFALFRGNRDGVELLADFAGSRAIWFAVTPDLFIASTSQRAVIRFLGAFQPNQQAIAWMLSCGSLGPGAGWDHRVHRLPPAGIARLNRHTWRLDVTEPPIEFHPEPVADAIHAARLGDALRESINSLPLDLPSWVLPLSGGYDSRALLLLRKHPADVHTVTWGTKSALEEPGNDAYVAREVAAAFGTRHRYFTVDLEAGRVEGILDQYLAAGEGQTDGLVGYLDGFATWRALRDAGVQGIVRGDHGFGPGPGPDPVTAEQVFQFNTMARWRDFAGAPSLARFGLAHLEEQPIPTSWERLPTESIIDWRDRLYQLYRIPVYIAAQTDLKAPFLEVASPLLVKRVLELTRQQPEHLRRSKKLFTDVVAPFDIPVPYARYSALVSSAELMSRPAFRTFICDELSSAPLRNAFTPAFADYLLGLWSAAEGGAISWGGLRRTFRRWVPESVKKAMPGHLRGKKLEMRWVAVRACIASRMIEKLGQAATAPIAASNSSESGFPHPHQ